MSPHFLILFLFFDTALNKPKKKKRKEKMEESADIYGIY